MTKVILSQDKERVKAIRQQLKEKGGYCPCRLTRTDDTKCPCKEFREAIVSQTIGKCHCGMYEIIDAGDDV